MGQTFKIKKGLDIPLKGKASDKVSVDILTGLFAICPDDFPGPMWKAMVKPEDRVKAGDPLFCDKNDPDICLVAPVSGVVKEINRGERRHINFISIEKSGNESVAEKPEATSVEGIRKTLKKSGLWAMMRQRPYDIVPAAESHPRDIFITAFDSAPLAPEFLDSTLIHGLQKGVDTLKKLTDGKIYIGIKPGQDLKVDGAEINFFEGPHPAGNIGTQIAAIKPVNKGETVWTLDIATLCRIGIFFETGKPDFSTNVAITGPEIKDPHVVKTTIGAAIDTLLKDNLISDAGIRIISGNVLTGIRVQPDGFLRYPYRQITVIPEGDDADEFMGWASINPSKFSVKRSFPAFLKGLSKPFDFDARVKGGRRAMIMSGEYDKVFPFDIYPEYLIKAIMAGDIDRMEKLGIYEVAPEDFALPEFVDTSKIELQKIVRDGLDNLRKELE